MTLYAAYGSNLDPAQMAKRAPTSPAQGTGWLMGWRLTFGGENLGWEGALATIVEDPGQSGLRDALRRPGWDETSWTRGRALRWVCTSRSGCGWTPGGTKVAWVTSSTATREACPLRGTSGSWPRRPKSRGAIGLRPRTPLPTLPIGRILTCRATTATSWAESYLHALTAEFTPLADGDRAAAMRAYMKDVAPFFGIAAATPVGRPRACPEHRWASCRPMTWRGRWVCCGHSPNASFTLRVNSSADWLRHSAGILRNPITNSSVTKAVVGHRGFPGNAGHCNRGA